MQHAKQEKARVAVYDFDNTSIDCSSPLRLVTHLLRAGYLSFGTSLKIGFWGIAYKFRLPVNESWVRGQVFKAFDGRSKVLTDQFLSQFYDQHIEKHFREEAEKSMREHLEEGHTVLVVSASFEPIVMRAMQIHGFSGQVSTRMKSNPDGTYTNEVDGACIEGEEKTAAIKRWCDAEFGEDKWEIVAAYGDHHSDEAMLAMAEQPYAVNPNSMLEKIAQERGWPILDWGVGKGMKDKKKKPVAKDAEAEKSAEKDAAAEAEKDTAQDAEAGAEKAEAVADGVKSEAESDAESADEQVEGEATAEPAEAFEEQSEEAPEEQSEDEAGATHKPKHGHVVEPDVDLDGEAETNGEAAVASDDADESATFEDEPEAADDKRPGAVGGVAYELIEITPDVLEDLAWKKHGADYPEVEVIEPSDFEAIIYADVLKPEPATEEEYAFVPIGVPEQEFEFEEEFELDEEPELEEELEQEPEVAEEVEPEPDLESEPEEEPEAEAESEPEPEPGVESETDPEPGPEEELTSEAASEPEADSEPDSESALEVESEAEAGSEPDPSNEG